jgi:putative phosphoesterase
MCQCANEEKFADGAQPISILAHYHISILISFPNIITFVLINKGKMTKVGLLSDTHGYWDEDCDEIWHAGDIGSLEVAQKLAAFRPFRAVYGNIDGQEIRQLYPQILRFTVDGAEVLMKHIGGYPGNYDPSIKGSILVRPPKLFISGHSHILKVKYDKTLDVLHINPGAAGIQGFHKVRTMVRFAVDGGTFKDLEVIELADR